jgi:hypothetical protein
MLCIEISSSSQSTSSATTAPTSTQNIPQREHTVTQRENYVMRLESWAETFSIPWDKMPSGIMKVLGQMKQLSSADKNRMVKVVVDEAKNVC